MRRLVSLGLLLLGLPGCAIAPPMSDPAWQTANVFCENPVLVPVADPECVWENLVDVVDDYFQIERESPVRRVGNVLTEGRLDTFPAVGSTLFEPWRRDSAGPYEKLESTLQSIRRRAVVRVAPGQGGYWVDVAVFKELEDAARPAYATAGDATFRNDASLVRVANPVGEQEVHEGWIPQGRDAALEQRILKQILSRTGAGSAPYALPGQSGPQPSGTY